MRSHNAARDCALSLYSGALLPAQILGSRYVLDLSSENVSTSAGKVTSITDLSPRGNSPSQGTASKQPTLQANVMDGRPSIRSDGADDVMRVAGTLSMGVAGDRPYYYVVVDPRSASATYTQDLIWCDTDGSASSSAITQELLHVSTTLAWRPNNVSTPCSVVNADLGPQLWTVRYLAGTVVKLDINNVEVASGTTSGGGGISTTPLWLSLFDRLSTPTVPGTWDFFRMIVANPSPTLDQHMAIVAYLKRTYPSLAITF